jgi:hypothetical protein
MSNLAKIARDKRDAELSKVATEEITGFSGAPVRKWKVTRGGCLIGFVEQFKPQQGEEHPFKALPLGWDRQVHGMIGAYYRSEQGNEAFTMAVDAVASHLK